MNRSIYMKIIAVLVMVLLCTSCGKDTSLQTLETAISAAAEEAARLEESLQDEMLTQLEMNETAGAIYAVWDDALNTAWEILQETLDDETMTQLEAEQEEWIAQREDAVQAAGTEVAGGSMYALAVNLKAAEITQKRVYELMEYLQ